MPQPSSSAWSTAHDELVRALAMVPAGPFTALVSRLRRPGRVFFTGQGRSGLLAQMAAMRFMQVGVSAHAVGEATTPSVRRGDTLVVISGSGRTPTSVNFARTAAGEGATVLLVTQESTSPLHDLADEAFVIDASSTVQFGNTLFEHVALVVLDAVVLELLSTLEDPLTRMKHNHANLQ